jgi:hypothetical protein
VLLHVEPSGRKRAYTPNATKQVKQVSALLAQKEVMVVSGRAFVMRRHTGNFHSADLAIRNKLFDGPIHCRDPQRRNLPPRLLANLRRRKRPLGALEHLAKNQFLFRHVGHPQKSGLKLRASPQISSHPSAHTLQIALIQIESQLSKLH